MRTFNIGTHVSISGVSRQAEEKNAAVSKVGSVALALQAEQEKQVLIDGLKDISSEIEEKKIVEISGLLQKLPWASQNFSAENNPAEELRLNLKHWDNEFTFEINIFLATYWPLNKIDLATFEPLEIGDPSLIALPSGHLFTKRCLKNQFQKKVINPYTRAIFTDKEKEHLVKSGVLFVQIDNQDLENDSQLNLSNQLPIWISILEGGLILLQRILQNYGHEHIRLLYRDIKRCICIANAMQDLYIEQRIDIEMLNSFLINFVCADIEALRLRFRSVPQWAAEVRFEEPDNLVKFINKLFCVDSVLVLLSALAGFALGVFLIFALIISLTPIAPLFLPIFLLGFSCVVAGGFNVFSRWQNGEPLFKRGSDFIVGLSLNVVVGVLITAFLSLIATSLLPIILPTTAVTSVIAVYSAIKPFIPLALLSISAVVDRLKICTFKNSMLNVFFALPVLIGGGAISLVLAIRKASGFFKNLSLRCMEIFSDNNVDAELPNDEYGFDDSPAPQLVEVVSVADMLRLNLGFDQNGFLMHEEEITPDREVAHAAPPPLIVGHANDLGNGEHAQSIRFS